MTDKQKQRVKEGLCPTCGEWAYPYRLCNKHRITQNVYRCLREFEKDGLVEVRFDSEGKKMFRWKKGVDKHFRKYSPESVAKMQLPRLKGKPMTEDVISKAIEKVLEDNGVPLTEQEINKGIKQLKTIGKVIPETDQLIAEYRLINQKKSSLSKNQRDAVKYKINFLLERKALTQDQILLL